MNHKTEWRKKPTNCPKMAIFLTSAVLKTFKSKEFRMFKKMMSVGVIILGVSLFGAKLGFCMTPEEMGEEIHKILGKYRAEHPEALINYGFSQGKDGAPPKIVSNWSNLLQVFQFYHLSTAHRELKKLVGFPAAPVHSNPDEIKEMKGKMTSTNRVLVINTLRPFQIEIILLND
jgi:hypothetical protein